MWQQSDEQYKKILTRFFYADIIESGHVYEISVYFVPCEADFKISRSLQCSDKALFCSAKSFALLKNEEEPENRTRAQQM